MAQTAASAEINRTEQDGPEHLIKQLPAERFTPYGLAKKLQAKALLESASFHKGRERYSILLVKEAFRLVEEENEVVFICDETRKRVRHRGADLLDTLLYFAGQHQQLEKEFPVPAGGVGYLAYEFAHRCDSIFFSPKTDPLDLPDGCFLFGHIFIIFDHYTDMLTIVGLNYREHAIDLEAAAAAVEEKINDLNFNYLVQPEKEYAASVPAGAGAQDRKRFTAAVEKVREEIAAGNLLQGVLSRRLTVETDLPALEAYKRLRSANPSPYLFYIDFGAYQLFGSSPEMHVKVKEGKVVIRPIAGTRRRGAGREEDRLLEKELLGDEKERAEHLMLVDLARNDIGRICLPGTVTVTEFMEVEYYSHVMHIVSQAEGKLAFGKTTADVIRATFPAGTVSGAPKIRAIETIDRLEPVPRRFYAGLVGYIGPDGSMDSCITIRSALKLSSRHNGTIILQAGAGIVYDSDPDREFEETNEKLRGLARAIGVEV
jgi:anthranilate synthase component I